MTLEREIGKKGGEAPLKRSSRPYVSHNVNKEDDIDTARKVRAALEEDKRRYGAEEHERRVREQIRKNLEKAEEFREKERKEAERKLKRMAEREAQGKVAAADSTEEEEEEDLTDNTVLVVAPDPRNASFGYPMLSTDYRLADAQRDFEKSNQDRAVVWRSGSSTVKSGGGRERREGKYKSTRRDGERERRRIRK